MRVRVLVVSTNREQSPQALVPVGAHLVAGAAAAAGHDVHFLDLGCERQPLPRLARLLLQKQPDVIALSMRNLDNCDAAAPRSYLPQVRAVVETCRAHSAAVIVIGGSAVSIAPEAVRSYVGADYAVSGEGEVAFPRLLETLERGESAVHPAPAPAADPVSLPGLQVAQVAAGYRRLGASWPLQTKRGCALQCSYCTYPLIEGAQWRLRGPDAVSEELQRARHSGLPLVEFVDSVFGLPADHALACCEAAARTLSLPLVAMDLNPAAVSVELVEAMNAAGFTAVGITAESGSERMLQTYGKNYDVAALHQAAGRLRRLQAAKLWIFMVGGPGETPATMGETVRFIESLPPDNLVFVTYGLRLLPGTPLATVLVRQGDLSPTQDLLWPTFHRSADLSLAEAERALAQATFPWANRVSVTDGAHPLLPWIQRLVPLVGRPPYWRYVPRLNRLRRALHL